MPLELIIAEFAVDFIVAMAACWAIGREKYVGRSPYWVAGALGCGLAGVLLLAGARVLPLWLTILLANEALLLVLVLLHQAVVSVLESPWQRYLSVSGALLIAQLLGLLYFTYATPDMRARIVIHSAVAAAQAAVSAWVLFEHDRPPELSVRLAAWTFAVFSLVEIVRVPATLIWPPLQERLQPGVLQDAFVFLAFILLLICSFGLVWVALCIQRSDLQRMATTDSLSGLMNRRAFDDRLKREVRRSRHGRRPVALLMIDLDHFKQINDTCGHQAGDDVIRRVGGLLGINTRAGDAVARYGGEEFAMILPGMTLDQAELIAERLRIQIEAVAGLPCATRVTASIGIAARADGDTAESLLRRSDEALYRSKRAGRNRVCAQAVDEPVSALR